MTSAAISEANSIERDLNIAAVRRTLRVRGSYRGEKIVILWNHHKLSALRMCYDFEVMSGYPESNWQNPHHSVSPQIAPLQQLPIQIP
jgi:hypothetical protein